MAAQQRQKISMVRADWYLSSWKIGIILCYYGNGDKPPKLLANSAATSIICKRMINKFVDWELKGTKQPTISQKIASKEDFINMAKMCIWSKKGQEVDHANFWFFIVSCLSFYGRCLEVAILQLCNIMMVSPPGSWGKVKF